MRHHENSTALIFVESGLRCPCIERPALGVKDQSIVDRYLVLSALRLVKIGDFGAPNLPGFFSGPPSVHWLKILEKFGPGVTNRTRRSRSGSRTVQCGFKFDGRFELRSYCRLGSC